VRDRGLQQALLQHLQPEWDKTFAEGPYGFRPGRSAHQAVAQAQRYLGEGYGWVVDLDLEKVFDRVTHDTLMSLVRKRGEDRRGLKLIDRDLRAGAVTDVGVEATIEVAQQGGPCRPCWQICCWTVSIRSWSVGGTGSCARRTIVTGTARAHALASG
jgi:RNA-directed DNA polymerase